MLYFDEKGLAKSQRIIIKRFETIEREPMDKINGIIVHQTGGDTAASSFNSYRNKGANGAHFLIDKEGIIYQTASVFKATWHVGKIKSRCYIEKKCKPAEVATIKKMLNKYKLLSDTEKLKPPQERYPANFDSIGIEIVGRPVSGKGENTVYETVNDNQNSALKWLITEICHSLKVPVTEIFRHPDVSYKVQTEAKTAEW